MPRKSPETNSVLTPAEVRLLNEFPKAVVNRLRVLAGDRRDDPRMRAPNATDIRRGYKQMDSDERVRVYAAVDKLLAAVQRSGRPV